jgi:hypothetical protein
MKIRTFVYVGALTVNVRDHNCCVDFDYYESVRFSVFAVAAIDED